MLTYAEDSNRLQILQALLLYMCPHTAIYVSAYEGYVVRIGASDGAGLGAASRYGRLQILPPPDTAASRYCCLQILPPPDTAASRYGRLQILLPPDTAVASDGGGRGSLQILLQILLLILAACRYCC